MIVKSEKRWALMNTEVVSLFGKYNWPYASDDDVKIPTFRTRAQARRRKRELGKYIAMVAKVVSVEVIVKCME